jgi:hypothetical protein
MLLKALIAISPVFHSAKTARSGGNFCTFWRKNRLFTARSGGKLCMFWRKQII